MTQSTTWHAHIILLTLAAITWVAAHQFLQQRDVEPIFPSPALTSQKWLSDYHPPLRGTLADTRVFVFDSGQPGSTLLVVGGTHANESAGSLAAIVLIETLEIDAGRVLVLPQANAAGFTHCDSQEAMLRKYAIGTACGPRWFRVGSRYTNPVVQWPDPTLFINRRGTFWASHRLAFPNDQEGNPGPGGNTLAGVDSRNLNRCFPGVSDGTLTEQVAYAITLLLLQEHVDLAVDLHEAAPEYPTVNVMVAHQRAEMVALGAELLLDEEGIRIATDTSVKSLRGLSHREWGDATQVMACLMETACPSMGRFKGRTTATQIVEGKDPCYRRVQMIQDELNERLARKRERQSHVGERGEAARRIVQVEIPETGISLEERVGRHLSCILGLVESMNLEFSEQPLILSGVPRLNELMQHGLGAYLHGPKGEPARIASLEEAE